MSVEEFMIIWTVIFTAVSAMALIVSVLLFIRNEWVYRERRKLADTPEFDRLPTYNEMLRRWWVWDIRKFL